MTTTSTQEIAPLWWRTATPNAGPRSSAGIAVIGVGAVGAFILGLAWSMEHSSYDEWGAYLVAPALIGITLPIARRIARRAGDPGLVRLIMLALVFKLLASLIYNALGSQLYDGEIDVELYHETGRSLAAHFDQGDFNLDPSRTNGPLVGTGFPSVVTGVIYALIGPTRSGGAMVFAWLGFLGLLGFTQAFRRAVPDGDHLRNMRLTLFLPSLVFWSSAIGKEALMMFTIGVTVYGAARLYGQARGGFIIVGLGLLGTAMVRPHITMFVFMGVAVGYLLRRQTKSPSPLAPLAKMAGVVVLLIGSVLVANQAKEFLQVEDFSASTVETTLEDIEGKTTIGGSTFETTATPSVKDFPGAILSVVFRPFPWEASNIQGLAAGIEGLALLVACAFALPRLRGCGRRLVRQPLLLCYVIYGLVFVFAFSSVGNFGLLVRERIQIIPLLPAFLALPKPLPVPTRAAQRSAPWMQR